MSKPSLAIILLEDSRQQQLIRKYLKKLSLKPHEMRFYSSPAGQGSAEGWVRRSFAEQISAYRNRQAKAASFLIVVIDADNHSVQERLAQLAQALKNAGKPPIDPGRDQVARLVPKRNIETWILCLNDQVVDEETNYKSPRDDWSELIAHAAEILAQRTSSAASGDVYLDSLRSGISELKRLKFRG